MRSSQIRGVVIILILLSIPFLGPIMMRMAVVPGPEGLNVEMYGAQWPSYSNAFHQIGQVAPNQVLESTTTNEVFFPVGAVESEVKIRCSYPNPSSTVFRKEVHNTVALFPVVAEGDYETNLLIERERPPIQDVNIHGDPLGYGDPTEIKYVEYHTPTITQGNQITFTKYCIHIVPVDFTVQLSVRGYKNLGWEDTHLWLKIYTVVWRNAFTQNQVEQIQEWLDRDPPENATISAYNYRGGFPIWGWIGEWDPLTWYDEEERETQPPQEALDNVRIYPSMEGREITLYTNPVYGGDGPDNGYEPPTIPDPEEPVYFTSIDFASGLDDPETLKSHVIGKISALPDPDFATEVYTPIYLEKFYPYVKTGPWYDPWEEQWFPTAKMRIRLLYAIYGEFVYLWTQDEAEDQGYEWEDRMSQYKYEEGPWEFLHSLGAFLVSPYGALSMILVLAVIVLIVIILINPALLLGLFGKKGGRRR